jgi:hypothetical protein
MRIHKAVVVLCLVFAFMLAVASLAGCGGSSSNDPVATAAAQDEDMTAEPTKILELSATAADAEGEVVTYKSEPFTSNGGALMVYLDVTRWGTYVFGGLEDDYWNGGVTCYLQVPGGYWDQETAPTALFEELERVDQQTGDKFVDQLGSSGAMPEAGTYVLIVEAQNLDGTVTLKELPQ